MLKRVVLGRPYLLWDDDPVRDCQAQDALERAARAVGFEEIAFQYEPTRRRSTSNRRSTASSSCWWPTSAAMSDFAGARDHSAASSLSGR